MYCYRLIVADLAGNQAWLCIVQHGHAIACCHTHHGCWKPRKLSLICLAPV